MDILIKQKVAIFFTQFKLQTYKKGEVLIRAGEDPSGVFYLKTGAIKQYLISQKGDELVVNIFKSGSFLPMSWAINNSENIFYFETATLCEVHKAPRNRVITFLKENPDVVFDLISRVYRGTDGLLLRMAYLMSGDASERLITELLIHAKRFGTQSAQGLLLTLSEKDLANQSGLTRETVSRELKKLKEKNLAIYTKGTIVIPRLEALESELL